MSTQHSTPGGFPIIACSRTTADLSRANAADPQPQRRPLILEAAELALCRATLLAAFFFRGRPQGDEGVEPAILIHVLDFAGKVVRLLRSSVATITATADKSGDGPGRTADLGS
jgi:hypothetical protein